jgi:hypothetical protein
MSWESDAVEFDAVESDTVSFEMRMSNAAMIP